MANPWDNDPIVSPNAGGPVVTALPESPGKRADRERDDANANRDNTRTAIQVRGEGRDINKMRFEQKRAFRSDFEGLKPVKDYRTIISQYAAGVTAGPNAAGDQKLINAYAQMLNPTSTVMLGEYQATEDPLKSTTFQIQQRLKKEFGWDGVSRIPEEGRRWIRDEMQGVASSANQAYVQQRQFYSDLAESQGFKPEEIVGPHAGSPYTDEIYDQRYDDRLAEKGWARDAQGNVVWAQDDGSQEGPDFTPEGDLRGNVSDDRPESYQDSYLGQGMSGINSGLATLGGAPVDLMTAGLNLVPKGINALAGTDIPQIQDPFLGSEWIRDKLGRGAIYDQSSDPSKQFVRRMGESVGASLLPAGLAGTLPRAGAALLTGAGGGAGAATAQQVFPGNPLAEIGGEIIGSGGTGLGMFGAARRNATRQIESQVPTVPQLKDQAGQLYRQAEARGVTAGPMQTQQLADDMRATLRRDGRVSPTGRVTDVYPKALEGMRTVDDYAGQPMNPTQMETTRKIIAEGMGSADANERRIGSLMTDTFDQFAEPLAPEFPQARDMASRYLTAEKLEQARELAEANASGLSQSGIENALRQQYRGLDRSTIKGNTRFNDDVTGAIEDVSRGTPGGNLARTAGKLAPRGVVSFGLGTGMPALLAGSATGSPTIGAATGTAALALGEIGRALATKSTKRAADVAELIARNGGKLPEPNIMTPELERLTAALAAAESAKYVAPQKPKRKGLFGR